MSHLGRPNGNKKQSTFVLCSRIFTIFDQLPNIDFEIPAQLADQAGVQTLEVIPTVTVEIGARNVQIFADLIFGDVAFFQNSFDLKGQFSISHVCTPLL